MWKIKCHLVVRLENATFWHPNTPVPTCEGACVPEVSSSYMIASFSNMPSHEVTLDIYIFTNRI